IEKLSASAPELRGSNGVIVAFQEYVEAITLRKVAQNEGIVSIAESGADHRSYVLGLLDAVGEFRRMALNSLRKRDIGKADKLSEQGAATEEVVSSTSDLAKGIGGSQQTASRRLIEMEKLGLIERSRDGRDQKVRITGDGLRELSDMYVNLKRVFEAPKKDLVITGAVFTGLSEGSYYMSREGYRKQFISK